MAAAAGGRLNLRAVGRAVDLASRLHVGQTCIHRVYGFRAVVFDRWLAKVYSKNVTAKDQLEHGYSTKLFYLLLRDRRDDPEEMAHLTTPSYAEHDHLLPFQSTSPLDNPDINAYFYRDQTQTYRPNDRHKTLLLAEHEALEHSPVFYNSSHGFVIRAIPTMVMLRSDLPNERYSWKYHISIFNGSAHPHQLVHRYWEIVDVDERVYKVSGNGAVGVQPHIEPGHRFCFESSAGPLSLNLRRMTGTFVLFNLYSKRDVSITIPTIWYTSNSPVQVP